MEKVKYAVCLVLLGGVGAAVYAYATGPKYGIKPGHELGQRKPMEKSLVERYDFKRTDVSEEREVEEGTLWRYVDVKRSKELNIRESVEVLEDDGGKVIGVRGVSLIPSDTEVLPKGYRTLSFMSRLWRDVGGPEKPGFKTISAGRGIFAQSYKVATFSKKGVQGVWLRSVSGPPMQVILLFTPDAEGVAGFESPPE